MKPLDRRTLLRGAGGVAVALPFLDAMVPLSVKAATEPTTKRFMVWYSPNGAEPQWWFKTGMKDRVNFELDVLAPLDAHRSDLTIVYNVHNQAGIDWAKEDDPETGHTAGIYSMLTGIKNTKGTSVDRLIANKLYDSQRHRRKALDALTVPTYRDAIGAMSYVPGKGAIYGEINPGVVWDAFFKNYTASDDTPSPRTIQRTALVDLVLGDYKRLRAKLGASDRLRLDDHITGIESLSQQLANPSAATCEPPERPSDYGTSDQLLKDTTRTQLIGGLHTDIAFHALACDLTPVANVMWGHPAGNSKYTSINVTDGHHTLTHPGSNNTLSAEYCNQQRRLIINWYAQTLADFATKLKNTQASSGGSLMDETLLYWTSEISEGNGHGLSSFAYALVGRLGSAIKGGQAIDLAKGPHNEVLTAMAKSFDVELTNGIVGEYGTGSLNLG